MSTPTEKTEAIRHAVQVARFRLNELKAKPFPTRAEIFERDMVLDCIQRGENILKGEA